MQTNRSKLCAGAHDRRAVRGVALMLSVLSLTLLAGCAGKPHQAKEQVFQRGWIGGQYKLAHVPRLFSPHDTVSTFPAELTHLQKDGVLVMRVATNAPAQLAGVREGDLIVQINHCPVTSLKSFRRLIEETPPGGFISVKLWRDGQFHESRICAGKEQYRRLHTIALGLFAHDLNFGTEPGFSLCVAGYNVNPGRRIDLEAADHEFARKYSNSQYAPWQHDWSVWLGIIEVSKGKVVIAQEPTSPGSAL